MPVKFNLASLPVNDAVTDGNEPVEVMLFPANVPFNLAQLPVNEELTVPDGVKLPEAVIVAAGTL